MTGPVFTMPVYLLAWVTLANVLVFVTGVVGNTLVILVVTLVRDMKTATNLCLMNLSIADLLVLLICQPSALTEFYAEETDNEQKAGTNIWPQPGTGYMD
nr:hypothetical protein BaRGS_007182 [Batillaria attramentaria]